MPRLRHLLTLTLGAALLHLPSVQAAEELPEAIKKIEAKGAKIVGQFDAPDGLRGYAAQLGAQPRRILQGNPPAVYPSAHAQHGVRLFPCTTRLAEQPLLAGLKHLNRLEQVIARAEWQDSEHVEGLMLDQAGRVIEGVFSNVFLVRDGVLITPDLKRCGVAGVMRAEILFQAESLAIPTQVADLGLEHLQRADEVFVCNSVYGVWPVRAYAALSWPVGPLTRKLQSIARALLDV